MKGSMRAVRDRPTWRGLRSGAIVERGVDRLTGLPGKGALAEECDRLARQSHDEGLPVGMIVCQLNDMHALSDNHGASLAGRVLAELADRVRAELDGSHTAYRIAADRLLVLLPGSDAEDAAVLGARIARAVRSEPLAGTLAAASFGIGASSSGTPFAFDAVLAGAEAAMHAARASASIRSRATRQRAAAMLEERQENGLSGWRPEPELLRERQA